MSRAYKLKVSQSTRKVIRAEDRVSSHLELLEILPKPQMGDLLAIELEKQGFERKGNLLSRTEENVEVVVDLDSSEVTARTEASNEIQLNGELEGHYYDDVKDSKAQTKKELEQQLSQKLEADKDTQKDKLQRETTDALEQSLISLRTELDQAVNKATAEALKQKAAQLGQIKEMTEDIEAGSLTIIVEV